MKLHLFFILMCLSPRLSLTQDLQWVRQAGGTYDTVITSLWDTGHGSHIDRNGLQYSTGKFFGVAQFDTVSLSGPNSSLEMYLVQYDENGNFQWARRAGGNSFADVGFFLVSDSLQNVYVVGNISRVANFDTIAYNSPYINNNYFYVAKYDISGAIQWVTPIYGLIAFRGISIDHWGNLYLAGYITESPAPNNLGLTGMVGHDVFAAKLDPEGQLLWIQKSEGNGDEVLVGMTGDALGNLYLTGYFEDTCYFGTDTLIPTSVRDLFIASYDPLGNVRWVRQAGGTQTGNTGIGQAIQLDSLGHLYLNGLILGPLPYQFDSISYFSSDPFLARYDTSGQIQWVRALSMPLLDFNMASDAIGNTYFAGILDSTTSTNYSTGLISAGDWDIYLTKYDSLGNLLWARRAGGKERDGGEGIAISPDGRNVALTGFFRSTANWESTGLTSYGGSDIFTARYTACSPTISRGATRPRCPGATTELYANTCPGITHQWLRDGLPVAGATTHILATNQAGAYQVILYDDGIADTSGVYLLEDAPPPVAPVILGDSTFCEGGFTVLSGPLEVLAWQWSNGFDERFFYTDTALTLTLAVIDTNGCQTPPSAPFTVTVLPTPPSPTISALSGDSLACDIVAASYTWLRDGLLLPDSTQVIFAAQSGQYQVIAVQQGCPSDTSAHYVHIASSIGGLPPGAGLHIWPQPAGEVLYVRLEGFPPAPARLCITDLAGKTLLLREGGPEFELPTTGLSSSVYLLEVQVGVWRAVRKVGVW